MKKCYTLFALLFCICANASPVNKDTASIAAGENENSAVKPVAAIFSLLKGATAGKAVLGFSKEGRTVEAFYFPGTSNKRALIIGGVHGSELSSIEVAQKLIQQLKNGAPSYYNVIVIPSLFPDNAVAAQSMPQLIGSTFNYGRYSCDMATDPNRQMPSLGKNLGEDEKDHLGREIEIENMLLLELINMYRPKRIVNIHAIRDTTKAGIYADPRTDAKGIALGYETDSSLAIEMAKYVYGNNGFIPGNHIDSSPSSLYYCDPPIAATGCMQKRNLHGSKLPNHRGEGVSLGAWASTAIHNESNVEYNRDAIRILTMEFPGYKRSGDYATQAEQDAIAKLAGIYAASIHTIFLEKYFEE